MSKQIDKSAGQLHEAASAIATHTAAVAHLTERLAEERAALMKQTERRDLALAALRTALHAPDEPAVEAPAPKARGKR